MLRAPAPPEARPEDPRPLPRTTTIPVQSLRGADELHLAPTLHALSTAVVIPAALSREDCPAPSFNLDKYSVEEATREETDARASARSSAQAERGCEAPPSLPNRAPPGDIQPAAAPHRVRRSPTPKSDSDTLAADDSSKNNKSIRIRESPQRRDDDVRASKSSEIRERGESTPKKEKVTKVEPVQRELVPKEHVPIEPVPKASSSRESTPKESVLKEPVSKKKASRGSLPKEVITKEPISKKLASKESIPKEPVPKEPVPKEAVPKEPVPKEPIPKESVSKEPIVKEPVTKEPVAMELALKDLIMKEPLASVTTHEDVPSVAVTLKLSSKKKSSASKPMKEKVVEQINTEEQAWDMLLNEPEKPVLYNVPPADEKTIEETKPKSKKNRKAKKLQDDAQMKDEDTFVEIHAIDDNPQPSSGDLVSISTPYEDIEPLSYSAKAKKSRSSKPYPTLDRTNVCGPTGNWPYDVMENTFVSKHAKIEDNDVASEFLFESSQKNKTEEIVTDVPKIDTLNISEGSSESISPCKESPRSTKSKSLSPYADRKSTEKRYETEVTDVYVIDTMKDEFPEIQITKGTKIRKKSPQPEKKVQEVEVVEKPMKSWSSIAATKNVKKEEKAEKEVETEIEKVIDNRNSDEGAGSSTEVSLQEKLIELCKRNDIMVAECDVPTELNFVEEHHSVLDLPPLEPLDFGLDDYKLEVMRDSLLEMNDGGTSPICKINIDNILSTIKETTNKAIESSAFNLIDLEKVPSKKEKGFSVVENDKITTQEVKIEEDKSEDKEIEVMDNPSDDDNTPPLGSTDTSEKSEKEKSTGASNVTMPSTKQSSKSKKSRKKKK